jgi:NitT/TauT family transport system ATP-binding protein
MTAQAERSPVLPASRPENSVPEISLNSVTKNFSPDRQILSPLTLEIPKGEFVSLIGLSGSGKSTILKLIAGLTPPTTGTIKIDGMSPANARETVSFIFQDATLLPWRTVEKNVGLGLELEGASRSKREEKLAALLELVGLTQVANSYPRELSGGMKMRVSIARALATKPRLLLMDEPFSALDELSRDHLNEELLRLRAEQNWTAVFVTHSVAEAVFLSTKIIVLAPNPGRIHQILEVNLPSKNPAQRTAQDRATPQFESEVARVSRTLREVQPA